MVNFDENSKKTKEYRNLAEFLSISVEEIKALEQANPKEYSAVLAKYISWCLNSFNETCFNFNEKAKNKLRADTTINDGGLTA